jgi:hypothetical protein
MYKTQWRHTSGHWLKFSKHASITIRTWNYVCSLVDKKRFRRIDYLHLQSWKDYYKDESSRYLRNAVSSIPNYIFFYPEDGGSRFLWNVGTYLPSYTILYSEDRGSRLLQNADTHLPTYKHHTPLFHQKDGGSLFLQNVGNIYQIT